MEEIEGNRSIKPLEGNMLFYLERTGGIAGQRKIFMLNSESLPQGDAQKLNQIVNDAVFFSLPEKLPEKNTGADLFYYRLTVEKFALSFSEGKKHTVEGNQLNIPPKLQSLIQILEMGTIPADQGKIITLADDGKKIVLKVNETFALKLGTEYDWNITIDDITIISRDPLAIYKEDIQGIYVAHEEGTAKLTAIGEPVCRKEEPPCEAPTRKFSIQVLVNRSKLATIEGTKWLLSSLNDKNVLKDSSITLDFADGSISGLAGCNNYNSEYTANDAGGLTIQDSIRITLMFCWKPEGIMQQEREYIDLLQIVTEYVIKGNNLILKTSDGRELVFNKMWSAIEGTKWLLSSLNNKNVLEGSNITLTFAEGHIGGSAGCNSYGSKYTANDAGALTIPDSIMATKKACMKPEGIMQQEQKYLSSLKNVVEYTIRRNKLILKTGDNRELVFMPLSS